MDKYSDEQKLEIAKYATLYMEKEAFNPIMLLKALKPLAKPALMGAGIGGGTNVLFGDKSKSFADRLVGGAALGGIVGGGLPLAMKFKNFRFLKKAPTKLLGGPKALTNQIPIEMRNLSGIWQR